MSPVKQELLAATEVASDKVLAKTLLFIKKIGRATDGKFLKTQPSKLDKFSEFLQSAGYYEDEYIDRSMTEITNK